MRYFILLLMVPTIAYADSASNGSFGINAGWTLPGGVKLQGQGVGLGQVEGFRPGKPGFDTHPDDINIAVKPFAVFNDGQNASPGDLIDDHATSVAGIMIGDTSVDDIPTLSYAGVSPMASLYSSAFNPPAPGNAFEDVMAASHNIADPNNTPRVRDINYSFVAPPAGLDSADGNQPLSQYVDWEAYRNDVLFVVGGPVDYQPDHPSPSDNFNGITVGGSTKMEAFGPWNQVADYMYYEEGNDADGERVSVDILAPGQFLHVLEPGNEVRPLGEGASFATPHVTGALAHLRQFGNHFIDTVGGEHWDNDAPHRHEVMKAVLLNSADKLKGIHGSSRDIYRKDGLRWHETTAAVDISVPLDQEMGAGHLNVRNALHQYRTGQWGNVSVPNIGWDYGTVGASQSYNLYELNRPLEAGEVVAATLCWDRRVETISPDQDDYTQGFFDYQDLTQVLVDLDLYLMPLGGDPNDVNDIIWASVSAVDSVEHIFIPVPEAGSYQLVVFNSGFGLDDAQEYGLAWWAGESLSGDFDGDGDVDGDDLDDWKLGFGPSGNGDADGDGDSDGADFLVWQRNVGAGVSPVASVPEPAGWLMLLVCAAASSKRAARRTDTCRPPCPALHISQGT